jgi:hypothetical protein
MKVCGWPTFHDLCVGNARKIKSPGHPAILVFFHTLQ